MLDLVMKVDKLVQQSDNQHRAKQNYTSQQYQAESNYHQYQADQDYHQYQADQDYTTIKQNRTTCTTNIKLSMTITTIKRSRTTCTTRNQTSLSIVNTQYLTLPLHLHLKQLIT